MVSLIRLNLVFFGIFALLSYSLWWYLFRKRSVVAYFTDAE
jgi:hypothetical protein